MKFKDFWEIEPKTYISERHPQNQYLKVYSLERPADKRVFHYFLSKTGVVFHICVDTTNDEIVDISN